MFRPSKLAGRIVSIRAIRDRHPYQRASILNILEFCTFFSDFPFLSKNLNELMYFSELPAAAPWFQLQLRVYRGRWLPAMQRLCPATAAGTLLPAAQGSVLTCGTCGDTMPWDQCRPVTRCVAILNPGTLTCSDCVVCLQCHVPVQDLALCSKLSYPS